LAPTSVPVAEAAQTTVLIDHQCRRRRSRKPALRRGLGGFLERSFLTAAAAAAVPHQQLGGVHSGLEGVLRIVHDHPKVFLSV
jgi:hypothetical protein